VPCDRQGAPWQRAVDVRLKAELATHRFEGGPFGVVGVLELQRHRDMRLHRHRRVWMDDDGTQQGRWPLAMKALLLAPRVLAVAATAVPSPVEGRVQDMITAQRRWLWWDRKEVHGDEIAARRLWAPVRKVQAIQKGRRQRKRKVRIRYS